MKPELIVLAMDASTTNVGWCLAQGSRYIDSNVFKPNGKKVEDRIRAIIMWADQMIQNHVPDLLAVEEPIGHHGNFRTDRLLARVYGAIEAVGLLRYTITLPVNPKTLRETGFHKKKRRNAARLVGKGTVTPDEADAIGVWQVALCQIQSMGLATKLNGEVHRT